MNLEPRLQCPWAGAGAPAARPFCKGIPAQRWWTCGGSTSGALRPDGRCVEPGITRDAGDCSNPLRAVPSQHRSREAARADRTNSAVRWERHSRRFVRERVVRRPRAMIGRARIEPGRRETAATGRVEPLWRDSLSWGCREIVEKDRRYLATVSHASRPLCAKREHR